MAMLEIALVMMAAQGAATAPTPAATGSIGTEELVAGRDRAAIAQIELNSSLDEEDPARLINLGVARARTGDYETARTLFQAVIDHDERIELETAEGKWVDSRRLARKAIGMIDRGEFQRYFALSMR